MFWDVLIAFFVGLFIGLTPTFAVVLACIGKVKEIDKNKWR